MRVARVDGRARVEEQVHDGRVAVVRRLMQGRARSDVRPVDEGPVPRAVVAVLQQESRDVDVAARRRGVERGPAAGRVDEALRRAVSRERGQLAEIPPRGGEEEAPRRARAPRVPAELGEGRGRRVARPAAERAPAREEPAVVDGGAPARRDAAQRRRVAEGHAGEELEEEVARQQLHGVTRASGTRGRTSRAATHGGHSTVFKQSSKKRQFLLAEAPSDELELAVRALVAAVILGRVGRLAVVAGPRRSGLSSPRPSRKQDVAAGQRLR